MSLHVTGVRGTYTTLFSCLRQGWLTLWKSFNTENIFCIWSQRGFRQIQLSFKPKQFNINYYRGELQCATFLQTYLCSIRLPTSHILRKAYSNKNAFSNRILPNSVSHPPPPPPPPLICAAFGEYFGSQLVTTKYYSKMVYGTICLIWHISHCILMIVIAILHLCTQGQTKTTH